MILWYSDNYVIKPITYYYSLVYSTRLPELCKLYCLIRLCFSSNFRDEQDLSYCFYAYEIFQWTIPKNCTWWSHQTIWQILGKISQCQNITNCSIAFCACYICPSIIWMVSFHPVALCHPVPETSNIYPVHYLHWDTVSKKTPKIYCLIIANIWSLISLWAS
jgi:hypothetical protein